MHFHTQPLCLQYIILSSYQQVNLLNPTQTSLRFIPMALAGFLVNVVTGYVMGRVPGQILILIGLLGTVVCKIHAARLISNFVKRDVY
jgi:hypothetical protein